MASFAQTYAAAVGAAVVEFLWQGALVGALAWLLLSLMARRPARERYAVAYGSLLACLASFAANVAWASAAPEAGVPRLMEGLAALQGVDEALARGLRYELWLAWFWSAGVGLLTLRFALQCGSTRRLTRQGLRAPSSAWQASFREMRTQLGVSPRIQLWISDKVDVPMVVGWLRPLVLVPAAALTGLRPDQVRSLLAHELAHIRRHDPVLNALQAIVEIVLFFHPAVWWISRQVRAEREYCCDDTSVALLGEPRTLAEALADMEALRSTQDRTPGVLASHGGPLMKRIVRILSVPSSSTSSAWQLPAGLAMSGLLALAGSASALTSVPQQEKRTEKKAIEVVVSDEAILKRLQAKVAEMEAAVKAGKVSKAEAAQHLTELQRRIEERMHALHQKRVELDIKHAWNKLQEEVDKGNLTMAEAKERLEVMRRRLPMVQKRQPQPDPELQIREISAAVEAGKLTPAEGKAKIEELRAKLALIKAEKEAKLEAVHAHIEAAIKEGRMTPEEGKLHLEEVRRSMETPRASSSAHRIEAAVREIRAAVAAGKLTAAEAEAKITDLQAGVAHRTAIVKARKEMELAMRDIEKALKAGTVSPEEARAKLHVLRSKLNEFEKKNGELQQKRVERKLPSPKPTEAGEAQRRRR